MCDQPFEELEIQPLHLYCTLCTEMQMDRRIDIQMHSMCLVLEKGA